MISSLASPTTASSSLQRFVVDELSRTEGLVERTLSGTLEQLAQPREGMLSTDERVHYRTLIDSLKRNAAPFRGEFSRRLHEFVQADLNGLDNASHDDAASDPGHGLHLMDETRVESDIEISRAAQLIDGSAEWELRELQTFVSTLAGQKHVAPEANPLRPLSYARALWAAACVVTPVPVQRGILVRIAAGVMSGQLKRAWAAACTRLEAQGVEPGIYRTVVFQPNATSRVPRFDVTRPGGLETLLSTMPSAKAPPAVTASSAALEKALLNFEALLHRTEPASPRSEPVPEPAATSPERQVMELMSRLFEAALTDSRLPSVLRSTVARLQAPTLRLSLSDPQMLGTHEHPAWQLLNRIALAGETTALPGDPRLAALATLCESLVDGIAAAQSPDAQSFRRSLQTLDTFLCEQLRDSQAAARPAIEALALAERRQDLERELSKRLTEQMAPIRTTPVIRRFVTGTWAQVLADSMLRFGEKAEPTIGYLRTVDELLWTLRLPDHRQSRQRLVQVLPGLLTRLRAGMAQIAFAAADQAAVLDDLIAAHTEALKPRNGPLITESEITPEQIVQQLRDEVLTELPRIASFSDSLIDVSSLDTVPSDAMSDTPTSAEEPGRRVDTMMPGTRLRLFLHGRWTRVQLLWRSPRAEFFLFAGESPSRTHSMTRRALERLTEERLARPLGEPSLAQYAVDCMLQKMGR